MRSSTTTKRPCCWLGNLSHKLHGGFVDLDRWRRSACGMAFFYDEKAVAKPWVETEPSTGNMGSCVVEGQRSAGCERLSLAD